MTNTTTGMVCAHHHLYSSLARGMPAPARTPKNLLDVLNLVWWKLDAALDREIIYWSAKLGAVEALMSGTTCIIDHHESPNAIEGSLSAIKQACDEVGVRVLTSYGITDRWQNDGTLISDGSTPRTMTSAAQRALNETAEFVRDGGRALVGIHAAFTCSDETLELAAQTASDLGVGVHVHVAEGDIDADAPKRLKPFADESWLLAHCVHMSENLPGTIVHNPRSNMNNGVGYAKPSMRENSVALGTDGIGADMLEEARIAYVALKDFDLSASADEVSNWLRNSNSLFPDSLNDIVTWNYDHMSEPWYTTFTTGIRATDVLVDGESVLQNGMPTRVDLQETRAKAQEQSIRLHERIANQ